MTHQEFIEKFCPNYKELEAQLRRLVYEYRQQEPLSEREFELNETILTLNETIFDNALQNFANKICERQRKECAESAYAAWGWVYPLGRPVERRGVDKESVLRANQPKIGDL